MTEKATKPAENAPALHRGWTPDYVALWAIALLSVLMNVFLLRETLIARAAFRQGISDAIAAIDHFEQTTISSDVTIDNTVVIETDLPVNETLPLEIKDTVPIDTMVTVPVNAGLLGQLNLNVPIKTSIPIDLTPTVTINRSFHVKAPVPLHLTLPIHVAVASTDLAATLDEVKSRLRALGERLDAPLLPVPAPATPEVR